jgi:hypothetical protein
MEKEQPLLLNEKWPEAIRIDTRDKVIVDQNWPQTLLESDEEEEEELEFDGNPREIGCFTCDRSSLG